ncbi:prolyl oligopeptidase, partial [Meira miltonrushii]
TNSNAPGWDPKKKPFPGVFRDNTTFTFQSAKDGKVIIEDPYNWLEKGDGNDVDRFKSQQTSFTDAYLSQCPNLSQDTEAIKKAANFPTVTLPKGQGPVNDLTYIYKVTFPNKERPIWFLAKYKDIEASRQNNYAILPGQPFFDENLISNDGKKNIVDFTLSPDGKIAAYTYDGGDGNLEIFFRKTSAPFLKGNSVDDDETRLPDHIVNQNGFFWVNDSSSIIYSQSGDKDQIRIHHLGKDQKDDLILLDSDSADPSSSYTVYKTQDNAWMMVYHGQGKDDGQPIYLASLTQPLTEPLKWLSITMGTNGYLAYYTNIGNDFYFSSNGDGANNYKMVRRHIDPSKARTVKTLSELKDETPEELVIPEHSGTLQAGVVFADGTLMAYYTEEAKHNIYLYDLRTGKLLQKVMENSGLYIQDIDSPALGNEAYLFTSTFNKPYVITRFAFDANKKLQSETIVDMKVSDVDLNSFTVELHQAPSKDGVQVPFTIMYTKGTKFDGTNPALLSFFGFLETDWYPYYNPYFLTWVQSYHGILVNINARGGSDKGYQWAKDGQLGNHQHTFDDILAVAEYLVEKKMAQRGKVALTAGGLGGTGAMAVANQAPEGLLGAVIADRSAFDLLRFDQINPSDKSLYYDIGNPGIPEQFDWLRAYSPLHNVNANKTYPFVFIAAAGRVNAATFPQHSYKMISELQYRRSINANPLLMYIIKDA